MWAPDGEPGLEHVRLSQHGGGIRADGVLIRHEDGRTFRVRYEISCDAGWRTREVRVTPLDAATSPLHLHADAQARWVTADGAAVPELAGCVDVDLWNAAFTNTLPIRRLGLRPGASADLAVAFIMPAPGVTRERQRYTCLEAGLGGSRYR